MIGKIENRFEHILVNRKNGGNLMPFGLFPRKRICQNQLAFLDSSEYVVRNYIKGVEWIGKHFTTFIRKIMSDRLIITFANDEEFIGSEIIITLYECVKEKKYDWFDKKIRISTKDTKSKNLLLIKSYFDQNFLQEKVKKNESLTKIYVCDGPPPMNKKMHEELMNCWH